MTVNDDGYFAEDDESRMVEIKDAKPGNTYRVHFPYSINVLVEEDDEEKKLLPVKRYKTPMKIPGAKNILVKNHHVTIAFAVTFHNI